MQCIFSCNIRYAAKSSTMKNTTRRILHLAALFAICWSCRASAIDIRPQMVIPGVHVGYIFGAGISFGAEVTYSPFVFKMGGGKTATGLYSSLTYFYSKGELYTQTWYHTFSCGALMFADNCFMVRAGASKSTLRWGRNNMNKTKSKHFSPELDVSYSPTRNGEYFGYRIFFPGNACFGLNIGIANEVYAAFRYNFDRKAFKDPGYPIFLKSK